MKIGGFTKQSLIDWPGKVAAVVFTQGCNFRCGFCHNPSLVLPSLMERAELVPESSVLKFLEKRVGWIEGVVITGGEPTIHPDLPEFIKRIRQLGYPIKLDTNGTNLDMLEHLLADGVLDYVAMDLKTVPQGDNYTMLVGRPSMQHLNGTICSAIALLDKSGVEFELRTTAVPEVHTDVVLAKIRQYVPQRASYSINKFRDGDTIAARQRECVQ